MHLNGSKKYITLFNVEKAGVKKEIASLDDIFNYADELCATVLIYNPLEKKAAKSNEKQPTP